MATETDSGEVPRSTSRYRTLRGKSISSPRVLDIFRDSSGSQDSSPLRRLRASSVHSMRGFKAENNAPDVPPLPSYALTPKPVNIPPPPTFKNRDDLKRPESAAQAVAAPDDLQEPFHSEPYENHPSPTQQPKSKPKLLGFGKKDLAEAEPLPTAPVYMEPDVQQAIAEQKKKDLARLQATLSTPPPKHKSSLLSLFSRSKKAATPTIAHPDTPSSIATTVFTSRANSLETASNPDSIKFLDSIEKIASPSTSTPNYTPVIHTQPSFERVSNDTLVPGFTANANGKRVAVRCQSSTINLPVTLETNSVDILLMASTMMRHHINPGTSVVVESYLMLGLERRLRRYERIRDVMNSWDKDHENSLLILTCPASMTDHDLDIDAVPNVDDSPSGFSLQLYQSSRPGKWNKRWVTLLENGQMFASKTADGLPGDPSTTMLCHMSESDIYSPKEAEMRQTLKPPKQFCYAIKSQQRSAVFHDEDSFVHFFSTDNEEVATQFYESVHRWRSWHLVSRKLALDRKLNAPAPQIMFDSNNGSDTSCDDAKLDSEPSSATSSFRIGSFQPLIDMDNISKLAAEARKLLPKPPVAQPVLPPSVETKKETHPPEPDFPPPATPVSKGNTPQAAKPGFEGAQRTDKSHGSSPGQAYTSPPPQADNS
ncbi:hypothetical protein NQ176_g4295 [Zarea fungicola]|uniref:Uncharacterized protein n=1 Tax=Zarea fungicola TaxID=93591 RepID=A0ACC1NEX0_9HYPO|nr:hypothetical protein NQ176_g4295 [Lecanicillium fungicola]